MNITYVPHSDNRYYFDEDLNLYGPSGLLTLPISKAGYKSVFIDRKYMPTIRSYHRAIAETFIPNPENKPCVNHINGIKTDNRLENLEWATSSENAIHSFSMGLQKPTRPCKKVINNITKEVYESVTDAANAFKISRSHLSNILTSRKTNKLNLNFYE